MQCMPKKDGSHLIRYVAFLRGINVGGKTIKMDDLKKLFASLGFTHVTTVLASGNVLFEAINASPGMIEDKLREAFGSKTSVSLRTYSEIEALIDSDPFGGIPVTRQTRLYVTFLPNKSRCSLKIPYESPEGDFRILKATDYEVFSVLDLSRGKGTTQAMEILEKEFGKEITTRNWNTVMKIARAS